ncbi:MAG TPA: ABC transporter ATP-binding protein [Candidatus Eisenbacteria bacterium]|nr:ABC transporter ATP-binding protein [Candidatus Eisenbacteria bacterium]
MTGLERTLVPLEIRGLTRRYGSLVAVDHLDLEVRAGEILGFLGPNGAGKTTTLRCISGLLRPHAGTIRVAGFDLEREALRARASMGFVPDRPFLYPRLTAREFLDLVGALYDVPGPRARERGDELLTRLDLGRERDDLIETFSLGMRQKVAVAAGLLHDPPLLLLDEPLGGLDPQSARALKDLLRERASAGFGVLVSTHLLDVAERLCDRVAIVSHGRLRASGTLEELRRGSGATTLEDVFLERVKEAP